MCGIDDKQAVTDPVQVTESGLRVADFDDLLERARYVAALPELRNSHVGFVGYGQTKPGDRILMAVDNHYDRDVVAALVTALRERGAHVDVMTVDAGPDRPFELLDEVRVTMRRRPWADEPRRWEGLPWVEALAEREGYNLLIHGKGGPTPRTDYRYAQFPWLGRDHFTQGVAIYPQELLALINQKTWDVIWKKGRGGRAHITDPEGTDINYSYLEDYYDGTHYGWVPEPRHVYGHLMSHPTPPLVERADAEGIVKGTTSHFSKAFTPITLTLDGGQVQRVEGGEAYGDAWRDLLEESRRQEYPCFPRPGLFYLWEAAIGGHPKIKRPRNIEYLSSGGFEWERRRSGIIHLGFGTLWRAPEEAWAGERGILYGHLHVHLLFPTYDVHSPSGEVTRIIENGRLTAMDDPEVRALAAKYGDPDELLRENWQAPIPGISVEGSYDDYARNPAEWIYQTARAAAE
jgi:hypothetical protein